jgi:thiamine transporter
MGKTSDYRAVQIMVEIALAAALAVVLSMLKLFRMPQGGSVSLEMIPVFYIALRHGGLWGCLTGLLMGLGQLFFGAYIVHPAQLILDYPLAFTLLGVSGFFRTIPAKKKMAWGLTLGAIGMIIGCALRFSSHLISGVIFFGEYAPEGMNVWLYSAVYNASYLIPAALISIVVVLLILAAEGKMRKG